MAKKIIVSLAFSIFFCVSASAEHLYKTYPLHTSGINTIKMSSDGKTFFSVGNDNAIKINDSGSGKTKFEIKDSSGPLDLALSKDGNYFATANFDNSVKLWDAKKNILIKNFAGHTKPVFSISISPDNNFLISSSYDKTVRLWDIKKGTELGKYFIENGLADEVKFSSDGKLLLLSTEKEYSIKKWESDKSLEKLQTVKAIDRKKFGFEKAVFSPEKFL